MSMRPGENTLQHWRARCLVESDGDCWIWAGGVQRECGQPQATIAGRRVSPHREVWQLLNGELTRELNLVSTCGNNRCINPEHRRPMPHRQLFRTLAKQGRLARGITFLATARANALKRSACRLTSIEQARAIREAVHAGECRSAVAERFGITRGYVNKIVAGVSWREASPWAI